MHTEIQVALRFVISFLYNKLPRRRVNLFGEELEAALRDKFQGHWYPDKPFKGSAYRCLKITDPADPVLNRAARESGNPVADIIENLPADLAVWIDPGEVSYRMGEKGAVKILYSEKESAAATVPNGGGGGNGLIINNEEMMVSSPAAEVRGFLTLDCSLTSSFNGLSLSQNGFNGQQQQHHGGGGINGNNGGGGTSPLVSPPVLPQPAAAVVTPPGVPVANPFQPRQPPVVYTAATFAQTKFGSTKLKTNSKKPNRMSPTEFSNYIKQRALQKSLQQQQQISVNYGSSNNINGSGSNSPPGSGGGPQQQQQHNGFFDKFYGSQQSSSGSSYFHNNMNNYNNMSAGANTFHKSLSSPGGNSGGGSNDFGLPLSSNQNLLLSPSSLSLGTGGFSLSDYTSLLADCWPDDEAETKNILEDILASAGSGTGSTNKHTAREERTIFSFLQLLTFHKLYPIF